MPQLDLDATRTFIAQVAGDRGQTFIDTLAAIAFAESGGDTTAIHDNYPDTVSDPNDPARYDYGLLQINSQHGYDTQRLLDDPVYNVQAGLELYDAALRVDAVGFSQWATYNSGAYLQYMPASTQPSTAPSTVDASSAYVGLDGMRAAWSRWQYWLGTELPGQWDRIAALLGMISGGGAVVVSPSPPAPAPTPAPTPPPPAPLPPDPYSLDALSPSDRDIAVRLMDSYQALLDSGQTLNLGYRVNWTGDPSPVTVALVQLGVVVVIGVTGVSGHAPGYTIPAGSIGARLWIPGEPRWW